MRDAPSGRRTEAVLPGLDDAAELEELAGEQLRLSKGGGERGVVLVDEADD